MSVRIFVFRQAAFPFRHTFGPAAPVFFPARRIHTRLGTENFRDTIQTPKEPPVLCIISFFYRFQPPPSVTENCFRSCEAIPSRPRKCPDSPRHDTGSDGPNLINYKERPPGKSAAPASGRLNRSGRTGDDKSRPCSGTAPNHAFLWP